MNHDVLPQLWPGVGILNANSGFETGVLPWVAQDNATISQSAVWAKAGTHSLLITPDGITANPAAVSETIPYWGGSVQVTAWFYSPQGWASAGGQICFNYFVGGSYLGGFYPAAVVLPAGVPTFISVQDNPSATSPGTNNIQAFVQFAGTPPVSTLLYVDQVFVRKLG